MKNIKFLFAIVVLGLLSFFYFQDKPATSSYELVDVKIYEVKDIVHSETHKTRDRDYNKNGDRVKKSFNENYYYDIHILNPSKYPEIKNVHESYLYDTEGYISDNWKDDEENEGYAIFEIYKNKKTGELESRLVEVHNHKKDAEMTAKMRLDEIKR
ncbi:hypothetical protein [Bacillus sp. FJAT-29814]|uniref:hypothetical protein n=1 Tax=Bacillus sp. FJAT-29814 TaxID=1729688 RepID=UPI00083024F6|nr:hypothetical protein [Bacillus sp. FJAT-29814]